MPEMIVPEKVRKGLYRAAEYLERHGWCQRQHQDGAGRVCVLGAITESIREAYDLGVGDLWRDPLLWAHAIDLEQPLDDAAIVRTGWRCFGACDYNDRFLMSAEDAAAWMREAADQ